MRSALQSYCDRPRHPSGPAPSHRAGSGGDVRHSCSTAESAAGSPAAGRGPQPGPWIQTLLPPPSCSEETQPCDQQGGLQRSLAVSMRIISGLCPPAVVRCLHARERAQRSQEAGWASPTPLASTQNWDNVIYSIINI